LDAGDTPSVTCFAGAEGAGETGPKRRALWAQRFPWGHAPIPPVLRLNTLRSFAAKGHDLALEVDLGAIATTPITMAKVHREGCKRLFSVSKTL